MCKREREREREREKKGDRSLVAAVHTHAVVSISSIASGADTVVTSNSVHTVRVLFTGVSSKHTLINICRQANKPHYSDAAQLLTNQTASPVQLMTPSPEYPSLHVHWKLPMVSMQLAFTWQLSVPSTHSLTSKFRSLKGESLHPLHTSYLLMQKVPFST